MDSASFTSLIAEYHRKLLSSIIHVPIETHKSIDLVDEDVGIEIKCRLRKYHKNFTIHAYQVEHFRESLNGQQLFWAFLRYGLRKPIEGITEEINLKRIVKDVEVTFMEWDFLKEFPVSNAYTGPYVYVKAKDLVGNFNLYERGKAKLYIPKGSILEDKLNSPHMLQKYLDSKDKEVLVEEDII